MFMDANEGFVFMLEIVIILLTWCGILLIRNAEYKSIYLNTCIDKNHEIGLLKRHIECLEYLNSCDDKDNEIERLKYQIEYLEHRLAESTDNRKE